MTTVRCAVCGISEWVESFLFGGPMAHIAYSIEPWRAEPICILCLCWKERILSPSP